MQRFVLLLGHPVYSLGVILFTLLLGGGLGSAIIRRLGSPARTMGLGDSRESSRQPRLFRGPAIAVRIVGAMAAALRHPRLPSHSCSLWDCCSACPALGHPADRRTPARRAAWTWGLNGAMSVLGATLAIHVAMSPASRGSPPTAR